MVLGRMFIRRLGSDSRGRRVGRTFYDTLQVKSDATSVEIKSQYFKLCKSIHPDAQNANGTSMDFVRLVEAYQVLRDARKRREYDASLGLAPTSRTFEQDRRSQWGQGTQKGQADASAEAEAAPWTRLADTQSRRAAELQKVKDAETKRRADEEAFRIRIYVIVTVLTGYVLALATYKHR